MTSDINPSSSVPVPLGAASDDATLLRRAAAHAAGSQQYPTGTLYVVATPIGNLADVTLRAIHVLGLVDAVACEDTRMAAGLLKHLGLHKPLIAAHQHNEREVAQTLIERLRRGERIALVSDAGTPAVSDPGARIVAALHDAGVRCVPIPGVSAAATALSVAGDPGSEAGFRFAGFLPSKGKARADALLVWAREPSTVVIYESPHRIADLIDGLAQACPARTVTVARELTKQFEELHTAPGIALPAWLQGDAHRSRGEFVVVLHAVATAEPATARDDRHDRLLRALMAVMPLKQGVDVAEAATGAPRKALYARALALRDDDGASAEPD